MIKSIVLALSLGVSLFTGMYAGDDTLIVSPNAEQIFTPLIGAPVAVPGALPTNDDFYVVSIAKKFYRGQALDKYERVFLTTLAATVSISALALGYLDKQAPKSSYALGAALGFLIGLPFASFNASEWYD